MSKKKLDKRLIEWAYEVKQRDSFICQADESYKYKCIGPLHSHHIVYKSRDKKLKYVLSNGITLCARHHYQLHIREAKKKKNKKYYREHLHRIMRENKKRSKTKPPVIVAVKEEKKVKTILRKSK